MKIAHNFSLIPNNSTSGERHMDTQDRPSSCCYGGYRDAKRSDMSPVASARQRWANPNTNGHREIPAPQLPPDTIKNIYKHDGYSKSKFMLPWEGLARVFAKPRTGHESLCQKDI